MNISNKYYPKNYLIHIFNPTNNRSISWLFGRYNFANKYSHQRNKEQENKEV